MRWTNAAQTVLAGMTALAISHQPALASPATLVCTNPQQPGNAPFTIVVDQAQGNVTINNPAQGEAPANSATYPATFSAQQITFVSNSWDYTIDRVSGVVTAAQSGVALHF